MIYTCSSDMRRADEMPEGRTLLVTGQWTPRHGTVRPTPAAGCAELPLTLGERVVLVVGLRLACAAIALVERLPRLAVLGMTNSRGKLEDGPSGTVGPYGRSHRRAFNLTVRRSRQQSSS
jgi:hypothetical protein